MKRVLVTGAVNIGKAGVATIVYKWGQEFDGDKVVYDYLMQRGLPEQRFQEAIKGKGGIIYTMEGPKFNPKEVILWVKHIIKKNCFKIIHINTDTAYIAAAYVQAAKKSGIEKIFVHSHSTQVDDASILRRLVKTALHYCFRPYVCQNTEVFLACSELAGQWMFGRRNVMGKRYKTIYNGVEVAKYLYNEGTRDKYRGLLRVGGKFVIGCIGRFSYQKNHGFLIDVFAEFVKKHPESALLLVGEGELRDGLESKVEKLGIKGQVVFLGIRDDVPDLLQAMDAMVMPSRFEGLPIVMVEAQMASLPCIVSGNITREAKFTENVAYIDGYDVHAWVEAIEEMMWKARDVDGANKVNSVFNIETAVLELSEILLS